MRLLIVSDLHLEQGNDWKLPAGLGFDVALLPGDIHSPGTRGVEWAARASTFGGKPVLMVPGNHEFYGAERVTELAAMRQAAAGTHVQVLDRGACVIDGVRFLGCTLWSDFMLPVRQPDGSMDANLMAAMLEAERAMNDYRCIETKVRETRDGRLRESRRLLRPEDTLALHWMDRDWLRRELAKPFDGRTVVLTHHAPASGSVAERHRGDSLSPSFVSELPDAFFDVPSVWVHGHTHTPADYVRLRCRMLSNPRGYRRRDGRFENAGFQAGYVIDLAQSNSGA